MTLAAQASSDFRETASAAQAIMALMHSSSLSKAVCVAAELVINAKTARALGLDIPLKLHQLADEVIE